MATHRAQNNFFHRLAPAVRFLISLAFAGIMHFVIPATGNINFDALIFWDMFACCYLVMCRLVFFTMPPKSIGNNASKEDGSKIYVFAMIIAASITGMVAVLLLIKDDTQTASSSLSLLVSLPAMICS